MARRNKYPGVYARWNTLWIRYRDEQGKEIRESTGLPVGRERDAFAILKSIKSRVRAAEAAPQEMDGDGPITVKMYATRWVKRRKERGIASAGDDETRFAKHINSRPVGGAPFGLMPIADVEPVHVRDLIRGLIADKNLAPRSIRNLYGMLAHRFAHRCC